VTARLIGALAALTLLVGAVPCAGAETAGPQVVSQLAPTGKLRAAINFGNPVLAQKDPATGEPRGVSAELARALGERLGVAVTFVTFPGAGKVFDALPTGVWDVAFLAIDPVRAAGIDFTAPYVLIEGVYAVPTHSALRTLDDVDRDDIRIAVSRGSVYDLYLTRALKHATLVRAATPPESLELFLSSRLESLAGVKQPIVAFAKAHDLRVIDRRFMSIDQAMGTPQGRPEGARYLRQFVEDMKASGLVAAALQRSGQAEATVAPPSPVK
jgi:polar amino acid transport system substrate-binding protein